MPNQCSNTYQSVCSRTPPLQRGNRVALSIAKLLKRLQNFTPCSFLSLINFLFLVCLVCVLTCDFFGSYLLRCVWVEPLPLVLYKVSCSGRKVFESALYTLLIKNITAVQVICFFGLVPCMNHLIRVGNMIFPSEMKIPEVMSIIQSSVCLNNPCGFLDPICQ